MKKGKIEAGIAAFQDFFELQKYFTFFHNLNFTRVLTFK